MSKFFTYFSDYFWYILGGLSILTLITNYFVPTLSDIDKCYHGLIIVISILAIDIKKWLAK